jgi:hypothetical protein
MTKIARGKSPRVRVADMNANASTSDARTAIAMRIASRTST